MSKKKGAKWEKVWARFALWLVKHFIMPKREVVRDLPREEDEVAVYVCNHSGAVGPLATAMYMDCKARSWMSYCVTDRKIAPNYIFHDFFFGRQYRCPAFARGLAKLVATLLIPLLETQNGVRVYRNDARIFKTFKESVDALRAGNNLVIFAESPKPHGKYVNTLYEGIADLGAFVWKVLKLKLNFYPVYIPPKERILRVGKPVQYNPDWSTDEARKELPKQIAERIEALGDLVKKHTPIPFLPKAYYRHYAAEFMECPEAYWQFVAQEYSK